MTQQAQPVFKVCPRCNQPAVLTQRNCGKCGREYQTTIHQSVPIEQTQVVWQAPLSSVVDQKKDAHSYDGFNTAAMWVLTVLAVIVYAPRNPMPAMFLDGGATLIALFLITSENKTVRTSAIVKLCLEALVFLLYFTASF